MFELDALFHFIKIQVEEDTLQTAWATSTSLCMLWSFENLTIV